MSGLFARIRSHSSGLPLDLKLAWRVLLKSPGLTVVGVLGLALGTAVGVGAFVVLTGFFFPKLPLADGDRIVALSLWDTESSRSVAPSAHDFVTWRDAMRSVQQIGAATMTEQALITGDAPPRPVRAAQMTAAGFDVARIPPLIGRHLVADDEIESASRVAVLGHDLWQLHFEGDPDVLGRSVLVAGEEHTVVGVMPPGFALPMNQEIWTPLRVNPVPTLDGRRSGPELFVFGRLAPGATRQEAQAEFTVLGRRAAAEYPETHARLRPRILPYTYPLDSIDDQNLWDAAQLQLMVNLLLLAVAVNIAVLVYARTATRQAEIAVRSALGASRRRIVMQLFMEALVFAGLGAALGLAVAHTMLAQATLLMEQIGGVGFWVDYSLQPRSIAFAVVLAVMSAVVIGVIPGLRSTGRRLNADLRRLGTGSSVRLGRGWTALIVAQLAVAVAVLPAALGLGYREIRLGAMRAAFPAHEVLTAGLGVAVPLRAGMDAADYRRETSARLAQRLPELERRLEAEPAVAGVTFEGRLPGRGRLVEVEGVPGRAAGGAHHIVSAGVATDYFALLGARILAGRGLGSGDVGESGIGIVVSENFTRRVLGDAPALGRRIRFVSEPERGQDAGQDAAGPWLEIVGVVQDLFASALDPTVAPPFVYYAVAPDQLQAAEVLVRVRGGDVAGFAPRFRDIVTTLDADFRLGTVGNLAAARTSRYLVMAVAAVAIVLTTVIMLSAAGIHALMSLTVTRRRREIGIRAALGARPGRLLAGIFSRAAWQLGLGGLAGCMLGALLLVGTGMAGRLGWLFLGFVVVLMLAAGLLAAVGPALRGLRVHPMEALREE